MRSRTRVRFRHAGGPLAWALAGALAWMPALGHTQEAAPSPFDWHADGMLQWTSESTRAGYAFGDARFATTEAEGRMDLVAKCLADACAGTNLVAKPRLRYYRVGAAGDALPEPAHAGVTELYASGTFGDTGSWTLGKRYVSWGPGLLYSPTNRLFPDNGAAQPRRELAGKTMAMTGIGIGQWVVSALTADTHAIDDAGRRHGGGFWLARAERSGVDDHPLTVGVVAGGGGGLARYAGGYVQKLVSDAWTVGAEFSASSAYAASAANAQPVRDRRGVDGLVNLRYGMASGGEVGLEFIYNGFALSDAAYANPFVSASPAGGEWQGRNFLRHPLAERRYVLLQGNWPKLFGDRRYGLLFRSLQGLEHKGGTDFVEASFSPADRVSIYLGVTRARGARASAFTRALARDAYLTLQFYF